jgi:hypothetical protein
VKVQTILSLTIKIALFIPLALVSIALAVVANVFCWFIALFVDANGNLPYLLRWFQTPDATCYDDMWVAEHPQWSKYKIALTWIARNPAYGFRKWIGASTNTSEALNVFGNLFIADGENGVAGWFFMVDASGYWNFSYIIDLGNGSCMRGTWGWNLVPVAKGYDSVNTSILETDLIRFYNFGTVGH